MSHPDLSRQPGVKISQILLERATFRHREDYLTLTVPPTPESVVGTINVQLESGVSDDGKSGLVRLQVSTIPENRPFYEFEVAMVALVTVDETAPNVPLSQYIHMAGAMLLYPFMRQVVADLTLRGRFGAVWLNPINLTAATASLKEPTPKRRQTRKRA